MKDEKVLMDKPRAVNVKEKYPLMWEAVNKNSGEKVSVNKLMAAIMKREGDIYEVKKKGGRARDLTTIINPEPKTPDPDKTVS